MFFRFGEIIVSESRLIRTQPTYWWKCLKFQRNPSFYKCRRNELTATILRWSRLTSGPRRIRSWMSLRHKTGFTGENPSFPILNVPQRTSSVFLWFRESSQGAASAVSSSLFLLWIVLSVCAGKKLLQNSTKQRLKVLSL